MQHPVFVSGNYNTHFIDDHLDDLMKKEECSDVCEDMAVITALIDYSDMLKKLQPEKKAAQLGNNWKDFGRKKGVLRF